MSDTPPHIQELYSRFIMAKSVQERFRMGFEMIDDGRRMIEQSINRQHPDWSEADRKFAVIERLYRDDFSDEEMARVKASFLAHYNQRQPC